MSTGQILLFPLTLWFLTKFLKTFPATSEIPKVFLYVLSFLIGHFFLLFGLYFLFEYQDKYFFLWSGLLTIFPLILVSTLLARTQTKFSLKAVAFLLYLVLFSLGIVLSMTIFGILLR